jgi:hypothetical protein
MQQNRVLNFTKQEKRIYEQILTSAKHDNFQKQEEIYLLFARKKGEINIKYTTLMLFSLLKSSFYYKAFAS